MYTSRYFIAISNQSESELENLSITLSRHRHLHRFISLILNSVVLALEPLQQYNNYKVTSESTAFLTSTMII